MVRLGRRDECRLRLHDHGHGDGNAKTLRSVAVTSLVMVMQRPSELLPTHRRSSGLSGDHRADILDPADDARPYRVRFGRR